MRKSVLAENAISSLYQHPSFLPPLWRVIYQEAVRGNHILFDHVPSGHYRSYSLTLGRPGESTGVRSKMQDSITAVMKASSLTEMKAIIKKMNRHERDVLFLMYERAIEAWKRQLKQELN